jgi:hypothetical protein
MDEKVMPTLTPLTKTLGDMSPWMEGWAPSTAHNGAHWLLPIMELTGGSQLLGDPTPPT